MLSIRRLLFAALGLIAALVVASLPAAAQKWPQRTVKFVLPLGAGSGVDIGTRLYADRLSKRWGQATVVENRPGGDGIVAISAVVNANDDHVLLAAPSSSFTHHPTSTRTCRTRRAISFRSRESPIPSSSSLSLSP